MNDLTSEKLDELIALSRKRKAVSTVIAVTLILLALLLVLTAVLALPRAARTLEWTDAALERLAEMADSVTAAAEDSGEAIARIGELDFDALNRAVNDLTTAVQSLVELQNLFG
jgi:FlaG/FlaF family flagellin (archaellin)